MSILFYFSVLKLCEITSVLEDFDERVLAEDLACLLYFTDCLNCLCDELLLGDIFRRDVLKSYFVIGRRLLLNNGLILNGDCFHEFCLVNFDAFVCTK